MRAILTLALIASFVVLSVAPVVFAVETGVGITPIIDTEDFEPLVWMCDSRVVLDDAVEPGRISGDGQNLVERINSYAFEGEQISWKVLVFDKNGIEKLRDVYASVDGGAYIVNCNLDQVLTNNDQVDSSCNARILEENISRVSSNTAAYYTCIFTVPTADILAGESWVTVEAEDLDGLIGIADEQEFWFLNPFIGLEVLGDIEFQNVRPGTSSYSTTLTVGNGAEIGSGVMLDMFISGTDFYDSAGNGAKCPTSNTLTLENFNYFVTNGAYSSRADGRSDNEGYVPIEYGIGFNNPNPFYNNNEILQVRQVGPYYTANILAPGSEMSITFRLNLPEPCNGDFDSGSIYFWGEAI